MPRSRIPRHAAKEHLPHWLIQAAQDASSIRIASPYVTSRRLLNRCPQGSIELYTDFTAMSFIMGASSLRVLKSVVVQRSKVFHVPDLHAKVVLIDDQFFSLGSQNLTAKGRTNVEASFISGNETPTDEVVAFFNQLQDLANPVMLEDIELMEKLVQPFLKNFRTLHLQGDDIDQRIENERKVREADALKRREEERRIREAAAKKRAQEEANRKTQEAELKRNSERMRVAERKWKIFSSNAAQTHPASIPSIVQRAPRAKSTSLMPVDKRNSYLELIRAKDVTPLRLYRYLMVNEVNGRVAFARLAHGQISFFSNSVRLSKIQVVLGIRFQLTIMFDWTEEGLAHRTGWIVIAFEDHAMNWAPTAEVDFIFSPDDLQFLEPRLLRHTKNPLVYIPSAQQLAQLSASTELRDIVWRQLVEPFKFSKNLNGRDARGFFPQSHGDRFTLKAVKFGPSTVLIATPVTE